MDSRFLVFSSMGNLIFMVLAVTIFRLAMSKPLGGRWIDNFEMTNTTDYYYEDETSSVDSSNVPSACFQTLAECSAKCPVSCREVNDCGGASGKQYACSWDLVIIVVAVAVLAAVLLFLCFLTWKQRQTRRNQLEHGRVDSSENLLRRCSRQRQGSIIAATVSSSDSNEGSRRNSFQPHSSLSNNSTTVISVSTSPTKGLYPHYL